jgi:hypothetical protein
MKMKKADILDKISTMTVKENDVIVFKFAADFGAKEANDVFETLHEAFPNNQILGLADDIDVLVQSPAKSIDMLEKMIAKIKLLHPEVVKPKILDV